MADLSFARNTILRIRLEMTKSPVLVAGRPNNDEKADAEATRLGGYIETLSIIMRDLKSAEHLIRLRETTVRRLPPEQRQPAEQSLNDRRKSIRGIQKEAALLRESLEDLLRKNGLMNPFQVGKALSELAETLHGHHDQSITSVISERPFITTLSAHAGHSPMTSAIPAVTFVVIALQWIQKKLKEKSGSK